MKLVEFTLTLASGKSLTFSTHTHGLIIKGKEYLAGNDGILIYTKTRRLKADSVVCQLSTNTSTLIPALHTLGLKYHPYFDRPEVVASQNNIAFYWSPSRLAAFYNRYSTSHLDYPKRRSVIKKAVAFLLETAKSKASFLPREMLAATREPIHLLGFYQGFPIFDNQTGFAKMLSRLGIHVDKNEVMISTPLDQHSREVRRLARQLETLLGIKASYKKNRVVFPASPSLLRELDL